ncbi:toxin YdaT family protein [Pectobacterium aroidearum]|uniref:toxin YdaT family protein n=1 Tax=Pectobacterium aroidearum TaxID=1201031 RepID=UPI002A82CC38|nr:toxin YdaT family protein [Pectobacterium aroidearum]MDY4387864.1 toxin YdaT family protein [Pectobacterium aroidearum]
MHTQTYQDYNYAKSGLLKPRNQFRQSVSAHAAVRDAVDAWQKTLPGKAQEAIALLVVEEWKRRGGRGLQLGDSVRNNKQNLFRWLDNPFNSKRYAGYIEQLAPVIADVMPIEIARQYGLKKGRTDPELVATAMKECSDAHQAKLLGAARHVLEKEVKEGIESLMRLMPPDSWGPVLSSVSAVLGQCF